MKAKDVILGLVLGSSIVGGFGMALGVRHGEKRYNEGVKDGMVSGFCNGIAITAKAFIEKDKTEES